MAAFLDFIMHYHTYNLTAKPQIARRLRKENKKRVKAFPCILCILCALNERSERAVKRFYV